MAFGSAMNNLNLGEKRNLLLPQLWEQQKQLEEQRREKERLEALRKKDKHDHSANASTEVKQRLQVNPFSLIHRFLLAERAARVSSVDIDR